MMYMLTPHLDKNLIIFSLVENKAEIRCQDKNCFSQPVRG